MTPVNQGCKRTIEDCQDHSLGQDILRRPKTAGTPSKRSLEEVEQDHDLSLGSDLLKKRKIELETPASELSLLESLPRDLITQIAFHSDLQGTTRLASSSRSLKASTGHKYIWDAFARQLGLTPSEHSRGQVQSFVEDLVQRARSVNLPIPKVPTLDQIRRLNAELKAHDTFIWSDILSFRIPTPYLNFDRLSTLEDKIAKANEFSNWCEEHREQLAQLSYIEHEGGELTSFPVSYIEHEGRELTSFPDEIVYLTGLQYLFLGSNKLTSISPQLCGLAALTELDIGNCRLTSLPPEIGNLTKLRRLSLENNFLFSIPKEFGRLTELEELDLSKNCLTLLPLEIGYLSALRSLYLHRNQLTHLPQNILDLTKLETLDLADNQFTYLLPGIGQLAALSHLKLSNNPLTIDPSRVFFLRSWLKKLDLSDNQIQPDREYTLTKHMIN